MASRYTLRIYHGKNEIERFEHRKPDKLKEILSHERFTRDYEPFGEPVVHPNRFEIYDSQRTKLFEGRLSYVIPFVNTL